MESKRPITSRSSLRHLLRKSTASLHERVDARMSQLLMQSDGYPQFLSATAAAILPLESALERANVSAVLPDWGRRSRSAALRSDLATLSLPEPDLEVTLQQSDEAYQLGILYVLEGSRLGARVILRKLHTVPNSKILKANQYLSHGQGEPLWESFLDRLEASCAGKSSPNAAIAGATHTFEMFAI